MAIHLLFNARVGAAICKLNVFGFQCHLQLFLAVQNSFLPYFIVVSINTLVYSADSFTVYCIYISSYFPIADNESAVLHIDRK